MIKKSKTDWEKPRGRVGKRLGSTIVPCSRKSGEK